MKVIVRLIALGVLPFYSWTTAGNAAVISSYDFTANSPTATFVSEGVSSGALSGGSGLTLYTITNNNTYGFPSALFSGGNDGVVVVQSGGTPNVNAAVAGNDYFELTITPQANREVEFSNMTFNAASTSDSQPRLFSIHVSTGSGFVQVANSAGLTYSGGVTSNTIDLSAYSAVANPITFRFYVVDGSNPPSTRRLGLDDLVFNGVVHTVPEPGKIVLLAVGAGLLIATRRLRSS